MMIPEPEKHFDGLVPERSELLLRLEREAAAEGIPIVGPVVGRLLHLLALMIQARRILELGTATGYSALHLASALPPQGGKMTCLERDPEMIRRARKNLEQAGLFDRVEVIPGQALEILPSLDDPFDLIFLDLDKEGYLPALADCHRLLRMGGLLVADNTAFSGTEGFTAALRDGPEWQDLHLLAHLPGHSPKRDGLSLARKIG